MAREDIFDEAFDEGTLTKLEIFEKYFEQWLPTFIMRQDKIPIQVFDLFAGIGYDIENIAGSPIRILDIINKFKDLLIEKEKKVNLYLNELDKKKYNSLVINVKEKISELSLESHVRVEITNDKFRNCLRNYKSKFLISANLLFIDQNGFKEVDEKVFSFLIQLNTTDFLFFISSAHIHRFAKTQEFNDSHPKFDADRIKSSSRKKVHNIVTEEYHKYIPNSISNFLLIPFSIIKSDNNNVYGLIFACKHELAADKFLQTLWGINPINGNANYDIDEDLSKDQLDLFEGKRLTKIEAFQNLLKENILSKEIINNKDAYLFSINNGYIHKHAQECVKQLKQQKIIDFPGKSPLINYAKVFKENKIIEFKVII